MATISGNDGVMTVDASSVTKLTAWTLTETSNMERDDGMGDAWQSSKGGKKRWSGSITFRYDDGGELVRAGDEVALVFYPAGNTAGKKSLTGNAIISEGDLGQDMDDRVMRTFNVEGQGALTEGTIGA